MNSPLGSKRIVQKWKTVGDSALHHPVPIKPPFRTKIVYFTDTPDAWAWHFSLAEGRALRISFDRSDTTQQLFVELFALTNRGPEPVAQTSDSALTFTAQQTRSFILQLQPELLITGSATLHVTERPSMKFPVRGGNHADIGGVFGDPRAGGARKHKGIDIFADRGTPVLAVTDGRISRTGNHGLGGKQVWMRAGGKAIYYAHLDSINERARQTVTAGDTLGFVGNTGNARTSPPHLHFSIYEHGAIDPQPFVDFARAKAESVSADPTRFPKWGRVKVAKANVRLLPSTRRPPLISLSRGDAVMVVAGTGQWYQVVLPDRSKGFIYQSLLEPADAQINHQKITLVDKLSSSYADSTGVTPDSVQTAGVYGYFNHRALVKFDDHWAWINRHP